MGCDHPSFVPIGPLAGESWHFQMPITAKCCNVRLLGNSCYHGNRILVSCWNSPTLSSHCVMASWTHQPHKTEHPTTRFYSRCSSCHNPPNLPWLWTSRQYDALHTALCGFIDALLLVSCILPFNDSVVRKVGFFRKDSSNFALIHHPSMTQLELNPGRPRLIY